mmetsp:Transcript_36823/g.78511  ORF Transcript_36823/g.78511 Transcript_36823/m.78511 type:complete len:1179 (+) Transcript_36823:87-3623(+)
MDGKADGIFPLRSIKLKSDRVEQLGRIMVLSSDVDRPPSRLGLRHRRKNSQSGLAAEKHSDNRRLVQENASSSSPSPPPDGMDSLIGAMRPSHGSKAHLQAISTIDKQFCYFAILGFCTYTALVAIVYAVVPKENIVRLDGVEQGSAIMAMSIIAMSFMSRTLPLLGNKGGQKNQLGSRRTNSHISWIFIGGLTVQFVALLTDFLMAFFPTPVLIDPVLGTRVHVLRWCEWCPCATFMTFMMEGADMYWTGELPPQSYMRQKYIHAFAQGGAVFLGLLFPFCPGYKSWMTCLVVACGLYLTNFPRIRNRRREIPKTLRNGATVEEAERFNAAQAALRLRYATTLVWSIIVTLYFVSSVFGSKFAPEGSVLRSPAANMMCECFFDVLSKVLFLNLIMDVNQAIFDPIARTERRLDELRQLMAAVWESSSDVIAISVRTAGSGGASTMLSPAFFSLGSSDGPLRNLSNEQIKDFFQRKSVLYQLSDEAFQTNMKTSSNDDEYDGPKVESEMIFNIEETGFSTVNLRGGELLFGGDGVEPESGPLRAVSDVVVKAWACEQRELVFSHDLKWTSAQYGKDHLIRSEAKVSRLDENTLIVIVRDISERVRAFEAEKQILFETTSRQKDAEANRFTRHEVKNGLLAAIGLYESLCDAQRSQLKKSQNQADVGIGFDLGTSDDVVRCMNELGKSLHETLDTILIEAMTRDLIHDLYRPHREKINISSVLSGFADENSFGVSGMSNLTRFPLITRPSPLPRFYLDPNILRYLHRHSLSNACKYGKTGGVVLTEIIYDEGQQEVQINVINLPGDNHDKLIAMSSKAEELVFAKGCQIHEMFQGDSVSCISKKTEAATNPGDGGWIMRKCAKIMKGDCSIKFDESRTVFSLSIPAKPYKAPQKNYTPTDVKTFSLPQQIWGIAIDDSKVQMKLLGKFFEFAGIQKDRVRVFGQTADEIMGFVDYVVNFMDENMGDYVLLIADENLDVVDEASRHVTISGSQLVENIRSRLLPEYEAKLVALIRSANDSLSDVAIYKSRAHGFLPKAPIKKANVLETLAPLWIARYPQQTAVDDDSQSQYSIGDSFSCNSVESSSTLDDFIVSTPIEIIHLVEEINALFLKGSVIEHMDIIWEKLHVLKGDLLTLHVGSKVISAVGMINSFRELRSSEELIERWNLFRENISHWLHTIV